MSGQGPCSVRPHCVLKVEDISYDVVFIGTNTATCNNAGGGGAGSKIWQPRHGIIDGFSLVEERIVDALVIEQLCFRFELRRMYRVTTVSFLLPLHLNATWWHCLKL
jgi:hypothetical protein